MRALARGATTVNKHDNDAFPSLKQKEEEGGDDKHKNNATLFFVAFVEDQASAVPLVLPLLTPFGLFPPSHTLSLSSHVS